MTSLIPFTARQWADHFRKKSEAAEARVAELEAAIREHRDRWAGQSTETDDALYAVLEGEK